MNCAPKHEIVKRMLEQGADRGDIARAIGVPRHHLGTYVARARGYRSPSAVRKQAAKRAARKEAERLRLEGMARTPDRIPLTRGKFALIDPEDFWRVARIKWNAHFEHGNWYAIASGGRKMHRLLLNARPGELVDHANGDGLDNRRSCNIRICTPAQNGMNKRGYSSGTKFKGIYWYRATGQWTGQITAPGGRRVSIGYHDSEIAAAKARDQLAIELHGAFAFLNFPEQAMARKRHIEARREQHQQGA